MSDFVAHLMEAHLPRKGKKSKIKSLSTVGKKRKIRQYFNLCLLYLSSKVKVETDNYPSN